MPAVHLTSMAVRSESSGGTLRKAWPNSSIWGAFHDLMAASLAILLCTWGEEVEVGRSEEMQRGRVAHLTYLLEELVDPEAFMDTPHIGVSGRGGCPRKRGALLCVGWLVAHTIERRLVGG